MKDWRGRKFRSHGQNAALAPLKSHVKMQQEKPWMQLSQSCLQLFALLFPANNLPSSFKFPQSPSHPSEFTHLTPKGLIFPPSPCLSVVFQIGQVTADQNTKISLLHVLLSGALPFQSGDPRHHNKWTRALFMQLPSKVIICIADMSMKKTQPRNRQSVPLKTQPIAPFTPLFCWKLKLKTPAA